MKNKKKLISIIMNCRNGEKYLEKSLKSIISQSHKNWELIFWDNNSSDNSKKIVKKIKDKRIKYFRTKKNFKLYKARNLAIKKASGKYICFLDTDDLWKKNFLKVHLNKILQNNCDIVFSKYIIKNEINRSLNINSRRKLPSGKITQFLLNNYLVGISAVLLKKKIFKDYQFNPNYQIIGDFDFFINLSLKYNFCAIQFPYMIYRFHAENFTNKNMNIYIKELVGWLNFKNRKFKNRFNLNQIRFTIFKLRLKSFLF